MADIVRVPPVVNMELYAGDGVSIRFTVLNTDDTPYPLDGVVTAWIKQKRTDPDPPVVMWTVDDTDQASGVVVLSLTGEETEALLNGNNNFAGVWDMQFIQTGAEPITLAQGKVTFDADVTH